MVYPLWVRLLDGLVDVVEPLECVVEQQQQQPQQQPPPFVLFSRSSRANVIDGCYVNIECYSKWKKGRSQRSVEVFSNKRVVKVNLSAHFPRSNRRAELGMKSGQRLLMANIDSTSSLDNDRISRALLTETPCFKTPISPQQSNYSTGN